MRRASSALCVVFAELDQAPAGFVEAVAKLSLLEIARRAST